MSSHQGPRVDTWKTVKHPVCNVHGKLDLRNRSNIVLLLESVEVLFFRLVLLCQTGNNFADLTIDNLSDVIQHRNIQKRHVPHHDSSGAQEQRPLQSVLPGRHL